MKRLAISLLGLIVIVGCSKPIGRQSTSSSGQSNEAGSSGAHYSVTITDAKFKSQVLEHEGVVMVDCWAPWCGPCVELSPTIEEIAQQYDGKAVVGKLNVDEQAETAINYQISSIPTLLFFKDGELVDTIVGFVTYDEIASVMDKHVEPETTEGDA